MGPERSIAKAYGVHKGGSGGSKPPGYWKTWANKNRWQARAEAWDAENNSKANEAAADRHEAAAEYLADELMTNVRTLVQIGQGELTKASMVRYLALKEAINLAGLVSVKRSEISGKNGEPIQTEARGFTSEQVEKLKAEFFGLPPEEYEN